MTNTIRVPAWRVATAVLLVAILASILLLGGGSDKRKAVTGVLLVVAVLGLAETLALRIVIDGEVLVVHRSLRKNIYRRPDVAGVEVEEGHVILRLSGGGRVALPTVNRAGDTRQVIASWLRQGD